MQVLADARSGEADLIISHYHIEEQRLVEQGVVLKRIVQNWR